LTQEPEVIVRKVPWIPLIALSGLLTFLASASFQLLTPLGCWPSALSFGIISRVTSLAVYPYLLLLIVYPLRRRLKISPQTLTYIYTVGLVSSYVLGFNYQDWVLLLTRPRLQDSLGLLNVWWEPPLSAVQDMVRGGVPTDFVGWGPIIFNISFLYISFFFFTSSISLIFRRSWIDVEKIPFPLTLSGHEMIKLMQGDGVQSYGGKKPFAIGMIMGFFFMVPIFLAMTFPWFPDVYGWRTLTICPSNTWHLPADNPVSSSVIGLASIALDPISVAIFFLAPLSVSFNVWFWTLVMFILEQIAYYMGYYTGAASLSGSAKLCCTSGVTTTAPFYWPIPSMLGGFLALTLMYIYLHRRYVLDTLRSALHHNIENERNEAMSYRSMYILMVLSFVASVISLMLLSIDFQAALIITLTGCFTTWFALTLILGMAGFGASDNRMWAVGFLRMIWPDPSTAPTDLDYVMSHLWAQDGVGQSTYGLGNGFLTIPLSLKMASLTGTSNRNTFLVAAVSWIVSVPILMASSVWFANLYGTPVLRWGNCAITDMCESSPAAQASRPSGMIYLTYGAVGFAWTALLSFLHARFIWFPFEPIGFIIATSFPGQWNGVWSTFLIAWALKTIVLRVGGSSLYEKIALPIVSGFIAGVVLTSTISVVTGMVRFYVPF
jgi:hypothetical protein